MLAGALLTTSAIVPAVGQEEVILRLLPYHTDAMVENYNPATKQADIAEAIKLMEAAGHKDGSGLKWKQINSGATVSDSNVRVKDQFNKTFPKLEITLGPAPDYASFTNVLNNKDYEARVYNHTLQVEDCAHIAIARRERSAVPPLIDDGGHE